MGDLESIIRHVEDIPESRYNLPKSLLKDSEKIRFVVADMLTGGRLSKTREWYSELYSCAHKKGVTIEELKDKVIKSPLIKEYERHQKRHELANFLVKGMIHNFYPWYNVLLNLVYPDEDPHWTFEIEYVPF